MALAISKEEVADFAQLLAQAGIVELQTNWRGLTCQFTEGLENDASEALKLLEHRLSLIDGKDAKKAFLERVTEATKELTTRRNKDAEAIASRRH